MPKHKKKFIDKKNAITFHLVHRSQQDPLVADEKAPQHVLVPQASKQSKNPQSRRDEQKKYGIYFDDDYNYLQHLRDHNTPVNHWEPVNYAPKTKLKLPSSVFASSVKEDVGLLNKAAPQGLRLDLDPDVVAAMDDDFDYDDPENELEDNFIQLAAGVPSDDEFNGDNEEDVDNRSDQCWSSNEEAERYDDIGSLDNDDVKSRFTNYSMSSSVIRRNDQLSMLDDRFEKMFSSYDETEIGALDCDEIEGDVDIESELLKQCAEEFEKETAKKVIDQGDHNLIRYDESDGSSVDEDLEEIEVKKQPQWDCESILSTRSNLYNHPKLITEEPTKIRLDRRGIPITGQRLTAKALAQLGSCNPSTGPGSLVSAVSTLSIRPKGETPEQRNERKHSLKELRKERRKERKLNTLAFRDEKQRMEKHMLNTRVNKNISVV